MAVIDEKHTLLCDKSVPRIIITFFKYLTQIREKDIQQTA